MASTWQDSFHQLVATFSGPCKVALLRLGAHPRVKGPFTKSTAGCANTVGLKDILSTSHGRGNPTLQVTLELALLFLLSNHTHLFPPISHPNDLFSYLGNSVLTCYDPYIYCLWNK